MPDSPAKPIPSFHGSRVRTLWSALSPWLGLVILNAVFILPEVARRVPDAPWKLLQASGDLIALLTIAGASLWLPKGGIWVRRLAFAYGLVLWIYMWDRMIGHTLLREDPLLYDQLFLIRHLLVLISDLMTWGRAFMALGALLGVFLLGVGARLLLRRMVRVTEPRFRRFHVVVAALVWLAVLGNSAQQSARGRRAHEVRWSHWITPDLIANLDASVDLYRAIEHSKSRSPYAAYDQIELTRKPDIQLFLVESYGRLLANHPDTAKHWERQLMAMQHTIDKAGWHAVSGFSRAPVSGGRSWLAEASVLMGMHVKWESTYHHLVGDIATTPNLVSFLKKQGYEAVLLAPKAKARPGVKLVNHYQYQHTLFFDDLDFGGKLVGWGGIPDQYSLGYAHDNVFEKLDAPIFTNFHMVSSHAPWRVIPPVVDDWRELDGTKAPQMEDEKSGAGELFVRLKRFNHREPRYDYMGEFDALKRRGYEAAIYYDLKILAKYLSELEGDRIVIIMGDHQPPIIAEENDSYDVPVHILARDPALLDEFRGAGFIDGLQLNSGRPTAVRHEGLYSLMVRTLVRCCAEDSAMPPYLPDGVKVWER